MTVYYVEFGGNDANTGLAVGPATAWLTIQHALNTAAANDVVYVKSQTYNELLTQGTSDQTFRGYGAVPGDTGTVNVLQPPGFGPCLTINTLVSNSIWTQFSFENSDVGPTVEVVGAGGGHIFTRCVFDGTGIGTAGITFTNPMLSPCRFIRCGFEGGFPGSPFIGVGPYGNGIRGWYFTECIFSNCSIAGIDLNSVSGGETLIEGCIFYNSAIGINIPGTVYVRIFSSIFSGCGVGVAIGNTTTVGRIRLFFNVFSGNTTAAVSYNSGTTRTMSWGQWDRNHYFNNATKIAVLGAGTLNEVGTGVAWNGGPNQTSGDPQFVDPANGTFLFPVTSPLLNASEFTYPALGLADTTTSQADRGPVQMKLAAGGGGGLHVNMPLTGGMT